MHVLPLPRICDRYITVTHVAVHKQNMCGFDESDEHYVLCVVRTHIQQYTILVYGIHIHIYLYAIRLVEC